MPRRPRSHGPAVTDEAWITIGLRPPLHNLGERRSNNGRKHFRMHWCEVPGPEAITGSNVRGLVGLFRSLADGWVNPTRLAKPKKGRQRQRTAAAYASHLAKAT